MNLQQRIKELEQRTVPAPEDADRCRREILAMLERIAEYVEPRDVTDAEAAAICAQWTEVLNERIAAARRGA